MTATQDDRTSLVLVLVGLGPRGAGLLERLVSNAAQDGSGPVEVHLVDPYPLGGGRVWRAAQSELLRLNTTAEDLTAFVDESVVMADLHKIRNVTDFAHPRPHLLREYPRVLSAMFEEYLRVDGLPKKEKQKKIVAMAKALPKRRLLDDLVGAARALT